MHFCHITQKCPSSVARILLRSSQVWLAQVSPDNYPTCACAKGLRKKLENPKLENCVQNPKNAYKNGDLNAVACEGSSR